MKITRTVIKNYRGIINADLAINEYTVLLGSNNSGKSTFLAAICAFYDQEPYKYKSSKDRPFRGSDGDETWVELEFQLDDHEAETVKQEYLLEGNLIRVRRYLESKNKAHDGKTKSGALYGYTSEGLTEEEYFYGEKSVGKGKLGRVIYIPAVSKVEDHTKLSGPSALRDLLNDMLKDIVSSSTSYEGLEESFGIFSGSIKAETTTGGRSINGLAAFMNTSLAEWGVDFAIGVRPPDAAELVKSLMSFSLKEMETEKECSAEDFGSGFQRHLVFSMINARANYTQPAKPQKKKVFQPDFTLLLFEEPEAFLHPPQQENLSASLREIASRSGQQVICSTHSPHFVSYEATDISSIIRLARADGVVSAFQASADFWTELAISTDTDDTEESDSKERLRHFLWLDPDRCGAFFADRVILAEGMTEQVLVRRLIKDKVVLQGSAGIHILDSLGKWNIPRFSKLLSQLGVSHSIFFDEDHGKSEKHIATNTEIKKLISDPHVSTVVSIPDTIETYLKIQNLECDMSQKPARILVAYESGAIPEKELSDFCLLLDSCFS